MRINKKTTLLILPVGIFVSLFFIFSPRIFRILAQEQKKTEVWNPEPKVVQPFNSNHKIPSDAIILYNGNGLGQWEGVNSKNKIWKEEDGFFTVEPKSGDIKTRRAFGDIQLHIEWRTPGDEEGKDQGKGNSGVFFQERYELQVLDSYKNRTYANGQAGSIYKQHIPLANATLPPGEWQSYDVIFIAPRFAKDSSLLSPARVTAFHNGVLIQYDVKLTGATRFIGQPEYKVHGKAPLRLQDHGNKVSYRNIWVRELDFYPEQDVLSIEEGFEPIFNGKNLDGWYSFLKGKGKNKDSEKVFLVENGLLHISGETFGYIATEKIYKDFHLKLQFRWGTDKWPPRENEKRDNGIMYAFPKDSTDKVWPSSIECQIQEGDVGDIWMIGNTIMEVDGKANHPKNYFRFQKKKDNEKPYGEWNEVEIIFKNGKCTHIVNGEVVNEGANANVREGRIAIQSEGAEIYFNNIRIKEL